MFVAQRFARLPLVELQTMVIKKARTDVFKRTSRNQKLITRHHLTVSYVSTVREVNVRRELFAGYMNSLFVMIPVIYLRSNQSVKRSYEYLFKLLYKLHIALRYFYSIRSSYPYVRYVRIGVVVFHSFFLFFFSFRHDMGNLHEC